MTRSTGELARVFEGAEILAALLRRTGSQVTVEDVIARMRDAQGRDGEAREVIPSLFAEEPRFEDPALARALYGNLLGLWDLLLAGLRPEDALRPGPTRAAVPPPPPRAPSKFSEEGPDASFVETAWQYLAADARERERRWHSFENRQDFLLGALDALDLPDGADAVARYLLFELHAMLELGRGARLRRIADVDLNSEPSDPLPPAFVGYIDESVFEAEQDEEEPLPPDEAEVVRRVARAGLWALWSAGSE